jgi:hypothetical protein
MRPLTLLMDCFHMQPATTIDCHLSAVLEITGNTSLVL